MSTAFVIGCLWLAACILVVLWNSKGGRFHVR